MTEKSLAVGEVSVGETGVGRSVVPVLGNVKLFWLARQWKRVLMHYHPPSVSLAFANSSSLPGSVMGRLIIGAGVSWCREGGNPDLC